MIQKLIFYNHCNGPFFMPHVLLPDPSLLSFFLPPCSLPPSLLPFSVPLRCTDRLSARMVWQFLHREQCVGEVLPYICTVLYFIPFLRYKNSKSRTHAHKLLLFCLVCILQSDMVMTFFENKTLKKQIPSKAPSWYGGSLQRICALNSVVFYTASYLSPHHLYTISEPDVDGILTVDPITLDGEISEEKLLSNSSLDRKLDLVMRKATMKSPFQPQSNGRFRSLLKAEFWRMGRALSRQNSRQRKILTERWLKNSWDINFKPTEIRSSLIAEEGIIRK